MSSESRKKQDAKEQAAKSLRQTKGRLGIGPARSLHASKPSRLATRNVGGNDLRSESARPISLARWRANHLAGGQDGAILSRKHIYFREEPVELCRDDVGEGPRFARRDISTEMSRVACPAQNNIRAELISTEPDSRLWQTGHSMFVQQLQDFIGIPLRFFDEAAGNEFI